MRTARRTIASVIAALLLSVVLALPASAAQVISYRGNTSAPTPNRFHFSVLKRDDGERFLQRLRIRYTVTCEDASTVASNISIRWARGPRLGEAGEFSWDYPPEGYPSSWYIAVEGAIGFRNASGTVTSAESILTDDRTDSQVCTTGDLTWTAERTDTQPARLTAATSPDATGGLIKIRVSSGIAEVVKVIEP